MYIVKKTASQGFILSDKQPKDLFGKKLFPGNKYQAASLLEDASGSGNVVTDDSAIEYLKSLKVGDRVDWMIPTDEQVQFRGKEGDTITLKRKWVDFDADKLADAIAAFINEEDEVEVPAKARKSSKA